MSATKVCNFSTSRFSHRGQPNRTIPSSPYSAAGRRWTGTPVRLSDPISLFHSAAYRPQPKGAIPRWSGFDLESRDLQPDDPVNHSDGAAMNGFVDLHGESITGVIETFDRVIF